MGLSPSLRRYTMSSLRLFAACSLLLTTSVAAANQRSSVLAFHQHSSSLTIHAGRLSQSQRQSSSAAPFRTTSPPAFKSKSTTTTRLAVLPAILADASNYLAAAVPVSPEPIHSAFSVATFLPQPFWLLMILLPNKGITKKIMGGLEIPLLCCLIHFFIVAASLVADGSDATAPLAEFNNVFDPAGDPQKAFMGMTSNYPNFVAEEWSHVLTWDLFVGRWIWLDGLRRGIFTPHSVLLCNLIGPPGLLLHWLTCAVTGKPILEESETTDLDDL